MIKSWIEKNKSYLSHPYVWIGASFLAYFLVLGHFLSAQKKLENLEKNALFLKRKKEWAQIKGLQEKKILKQLKNANRDYIETHLQKMIFLQPEIKKLQALVHCDPHDQERNKRLDFLQNGKNMLQFKQQHFRIQKGFQEVDVIQEHSVEMNATDLKCLLANIENKSIGSIHPDGCPPHFIITKCELLKKPLDSNEEIFVVKLELIKREIAHE